MAVIAQLSAFRATSGDPETVTLSFVGLTGARCMVSVLVSVRAGFTSGTVSATWENAAGGGPVPITHRRSRDDGFQRAWVVVLALPLGDFTNVDGDVVISYSAPETNISIAAHVTMHSEILQLDPDFQRTTAVAQITNAASPITATLGGTVAGDICEAVITNNQVGRSHTTDPLGKELVIWDPLGPGSGSGMAWRDTSTGGSFPMTANYTGTAFVLGAAIAYVTDITPGPVLLSATGSRGAGKSILPGDTNVTVGHTNGDLPGVTKLYLGDDANFATATLVEQTISAVGVSTLNWDAVTLGPLQLGPQFLFLETDSGGGSELQSDAFPVIISAKNILVAARAYKCLGTEVGLTPVSADVPFVPRGALIRVNATTSRGAFNPQWVSTVCVVDDVTAAGECAASQHSPAVHKRAQANGANSLIVLNPTTAGSANFMTGTPSLTDTGMLVDFGLVTAGFELVILFFGGNTCQAAIREIVVSDLSVSDLPFDPEIFYASSTNQTSGAASDTTFSRQAMGWCKGPGVGESVHMVVDNDAAGARNSTITDGTGIVLSQISGTTLDYTMTVTSFDSNGITWTTAGAGTGDSAYLLFLNLDGAVTFVNLWAKESGGVNDTTENLPDTGIPNLGWLWQMNALRADELVSPAVGSKWDTGLVGQDGSHSELAVFNPAAGTGVAECRLTFGVFVEGSSSASSVDLVGKITKFGQQPEIQWTTNTASAVLFGLVGWETEDNNETGERGLSPQMLGALGPKG